MHTYTCTYINTNTHETTWQHYIRPTKKVYVLNNDTECMSIADKNDIRNWRKFLKNMNPSLLSMSCQNTAPTLKGPQFLLRLIHQAMSEGAFSPQHD